MLNSEKTKKMNKKEMIESVAGEAKMAKADAERALNGITNGITKALKKGQRVVLVGFGSFHVVKRKARMGRNPQSGKPIKIGAKKAVRFKVGSALKLAVAR